MLHPWSISNLEKKMNRDWPEYADSLKKDKAKLLDKVNDGYLQVPESWLSDKRCHLCGYTEECRPTEELCMCSIAKKVIMTPYPEPPSRSGTLNKNKGKNDLTVSYLGAFRCLKLVTIALLKTFLNQGRRRGSRWSTTLQTRKSRTNSDPITFNRPNYEHNF